MKGLFSHSLLSEHATPWREQSHAWLLFTTETRQGRERLQIGTSAGLSNMDLCCTLSLTDF